MVNQRKVNTKTVSVLEDIPLADRLSARIEALEETPWLDATVKYEPWETGHTCGVSGHDTDCLCDVRVPNAIGIKPIATGAIHELAHLHTNHGSRFVSGSQFADFLETVATMHGAYVDYCRTTSFRQDTHSAVGGRSVPAYGARTVDPYARARCLEMLEAGASWPSCRQWLTINGFEREQRWYRRSLERQIERIKKEREAHATT